jgi:hypothetical protein
MLYSLNPVIINSMKYRLLKCRTDFLKDYDLIDFTYISIIREGWKIID